MANLQLNKQQLQQLIQLVIAGALAAQAAQQQAQQPVQQAAVAAQQTLFVVVPGGAEDQPWDFTLGYSLKLWTNATKLLSDTKWDGEQKRLYHFLDKLKERASSFGLMCILMITVGTNTLNLLTQYGSLTLQNVRDNVNMYRNADAGVNGKRQQCASILSKLMKASISPELDG